MCCTSEFLTCNSRTADQKVKIGELCSCQIQHGFQEVFQFGLKSLHSTEAVMVNVFNDVLVDTDSSQWLIT